MVLRLRDVVRIRAQHRFAQDDNDLILDANFLADRSVRSTRNYAFLGAIASLAALATRNFTTVFALI